MRILVSFASLWALAACASAPRAAESTSRLSRFPDPDQISIAPDDSLPRPMYTTGGPRYPADLRAAGVTGRLVAAFVIDTTGRAELPSVSFVERASDPGFHTAVCDFLRQARFVPSHAAGAPRRALVFVPFQFWLESAGPPLPLPAMGRYKTLMRETPRRELFAALEAHPHC
jgi:TonB family protein